MSQWTPDRTSPVALLAVLAALAAAAAGSRASVSRGADLRHQQWRRWHGQTAGRGLRFRQQRLSGGCRRDDQRALRRGRRHAARERVLHPGVARLQPDAARRLQPRDSAASWSRGSTRGRTRTSRRSGAGWCGSVRAGRPATPAVISSSGPPSLASTASAARPSPTRRSADGSSCCSTSTGGGVARLPADDIRGQLVGNDGQLIGAPIIVTFDNHFQGETGVAYSPASNQFLVAYRHFYEPAGPATVQVRTHRRQLGALGGPVDVRRAR